MSECLSRLLQPYSERLHQIALLDPADSDIIEFKGGQWAARSPGEYWVDLLADPTVAAYAYTALPWTINNDKHLLGRDSALPPFNAMEIEIGSGLDLSAGVLSVDTSSGFVTGITGTLNQVAANGDYVNPQTGPVTLSLPQDIHTGATPTFAGLTLGSPLSVANGGTGLTAFGTGVATALGINVGSPGAFITSGGALGTPSSGTVTNLTGTASININGTVGATTPSTGVFTYIRSVAEALPAPSSAFFDYSGGDARIIASGPNTLTKSRVLLYAVNSDSTSASLMGVFDPNGFQGAVGATTPSAGSFTTFSSTGSVGIGTPVLGGFRADIVYDSNASIEGISMVDEATSGSNFAIRFIQNSSIVGGIVTSNTATAYNTSSDRRLKTNIRDYTSSASIIDAIKPRVYDWKTGEKDTVGFVAQELHAVYPAAVTKGDDGEEIEHQWAADYSKLVPVLVAELQALRQRVAELEAASQ